MRQFRLKWRKDKTKRETNGMQKNRIEHEIEMTKIWSITSEKFAFARDAKNVVVVLLIKRKGRNYITIKGKIVVCVFYLAFTCKNELSLSKNVKLFNILRLDWFKVALMESVKHMTKIGLFWLGWITVRRLKNRKSAY